MKKRWFQVLLLLSLICLGATNVLAHCEIPCGIYDDQMRIKMMDEHITTIEKSMNEIIKLGATEPLNYNQLVRWVMNKEHHADEVQEIVSQYFMTQRIKPGSKDYSKKLILLHKMLIQAMKCKQTTDHSHITAIRALLREFEGLYFGKGNK
jgi:nickel superoxide dismutase